MLTEDQLKKYLAELRRYASIASNAASVSVRASRDVTAVAEQAASAALATRLAALNVETGAADAAAEWDNPTNTLTIPVGAAGQDGSDGAPGQDGVDGVDGTSITIRIATASTAATMSNQYPNDLIVVPA